MEITLKYYHSVITFFLFFFFSFLKIYVCHFCLYYDRTDQSWQEVKWERDRGAGSIGKGPLVKIWTRDACGAMTLYMSVSSYDILIRAAW